MSLLSKDVDQFLLAENRESIELKSVTMELDKVRNIKMWSNYTLFDFDLDKPESFGNAVSLGFMAIAGISLAVLVLCCCSCACCRNAAWSCLKLLCKGLWRLTRIICKCTYAKFCETVNKSLIYRTCRSLIVQIAKIVRNVSIFPICLPKNQLG